MARILLPLMCGVLALTACTSPSATQEAAPVSPPTPSARSVAVSPPPSPSPALPPVTPPSSSGPLPAQDPPRVAQDPAGLAQQIVAAERTIRSDAAGDAVAAAGHLQQAAYRELAARPAWRRAVLDDVPAELRSSVVAHVDALTDLRRLTRPQPRLPSWRIVAPPPAQELLAHYREAEQVHGVGWEYLAAIHLVETRMGRIRGTSSAGARGPMQFMPQTWKAYGKGDIDDPRDAIQAAARYLKASGAPRNMRRALFAYNRSDAYVRAIEVHAAQMRAEPRVYRGYYHWQVYYRTTNGDKVLPVGYDGRR